jgi:hypothetical protein
MSGNRRTRRRMLAAATGLVVAGGVALGAVVVDSAGASTPGAPTAAASGHTIVSLPQCASQNAPNTRTASGNPPTRPSATSSAASTSAAPATSAASSDTGAARTAGADSGVPSAQRKVQLTTTQVPGFSAEQWKPVGSPVVRAVAGHDIGENECVSIDGAAGWVQQSFSGAGQNVAIQDSFTFADAAAAHTGYAEVVSDMASCAQTSRSLQAKSGIGQDAKIARTASTPSAAAWERTWTGVVGMSSGGPQINHLYATVSGSELIVLQFTEFPGQAAPYDTAMDPGVLAMLANELAR